MNGRIEPKGAAIIPPPVRCSSAWLTASDNARRVLIAMAQRHNGHNNGLLAFAGEDGAAIGLSARETELALLELERIGLISSCSTGPVQ
ncbi:MAG: hypothetical protein JO001_30215 [Alphaproteobacteria bacterium]|nr:hypothetical protein [Alphaproteobacteria bacterium]